MWDIFGFTGTCVTLLAFILYRYERWERFATENQRIPFRNWLRNPNLGRSILSSWPRPFIVSFDKFFGERHLSLRCFFKSCIASFVFVTITCILFYRWHPEFIEETIENKWQAMLTYFTLPLILNILPDYIALLKSRAIVHGLGTFHVGEKPPTIRIIAFDLLANFIISSTALFLFFLITGFHYEIHGRMWLRDIPTPGMPEPPLGEPFYTYVRLINTGEFFIGAIFFSNSFGIFFYSTFFTSLSIWFFVLATFGVRQLKRIDERMKFINLSKFLDEESMNKEPIACFGFILTCGVGIPLLIFVDLILIIHWYFS